MKKSKRLLKRSEYPILEEEYDKNCTEIHQINLSNFERKSFPTFYNDPSVKSFFISDTSELGHVFYYKEKEIKKYPSAKSLGWKPRIDKDLSDNEFLKLLIMQTLKLQNFLISNYIVKINDTNTFKRMEERKNIALKFNEKMLTNIKYKMYIC